MKKISLIISLFLVFVLAGCQPNTKPIREELNKLLEDQVSLVKNESYHSKADGEKIHLGGFSSYTVSRDDEGFSLYLLKHKVYSELNFTWQYSEGTLYIDWIEIIYLDTDNEVYISLSTEIDESYEYSLSSYTNFVKELSQMRLKDIKWILDSFEFDLG